MAATKSGAWSSPGTVAAARLLVGGVFLVAGIGKLLEPAGAFAQILGAYRLVPAEAVPLIATWLPWGELVLGVYLIVGFETRWAGAAAAVCFAVFSAAIATNLILGAPLEDCGCFGTLLKREGATVTLVGDLILGGVSLWLVRHPVSRTSLDGWLEARGW
ncbi:MAG: MauE/DoxX family redox-associated membrane protein [bacterium]|nr:MauE/DoxX family redox-associated membrane protein [bacterium]